MVFSTLRQGIAYGDEVKWTWMASIGGLNSSAITDTYLYEQTGFPFPNRDCVLTKLIFYGTGYYTTLRTVQFPALILQEDRSVGD